MSNVIHFEIGVDDLPRATNFYSKVFGWELREFKNENSVLIFPNLHNQQEKQKHEGEILPTIGMGSIQIRHHQESISVTFRVSALQKQNWKVTEE